MDRNVVPDQASDPEGSGPDLEVPRPLGLVVARLEAEGRLVGEVQVPLVVAVAAEAAPVATAVE